MKKFIASFLAALVVAWAPGLQSYEAVAQTISFGGQAGKAPVPVPAGLVPSAGVGSPSSYNPSLQSGLILPTLGAPAISPSLGGSLPGMGSVPGLQSPSIAVLGLPASVVPGIHTAAVPALAAPNSPAAPKTKDAEGNQAVSAREILETGASQAVKAKDTASLSSVLAKIFTGDFQASGDATGSFAPADESASSRGQGAWSQSQTLTYSEPAASVQADLEAVAVDQSKPEAERKKAVETISSQAGPEAEAALKRIAGANPGGGASDYEVHRWALRGLAERGTIVSLRPVSQGHARQILARLAANRPDLAIFDYDDTLASWAKPISAETADALKAAADAGIQPVILTDRPDRSDNPKETTILQSIAGMTARQKASLAVVSSKGTRASIYDGKSEPRLVRDVQVSWEPAEAEAIKAAGRAVKERYGSTVFNGREEDLSKDSYFRPLPVGTPEADVAAAAELMKSELKKRGVDVEVIGRMAKDPALPPYISLSKVDKSVGVSWLRTHAGFIGRLRDLARLGVAGRLFDKLSALLGRFNGRQVPVSKMLIVGDQFFGSRMTDRNMLKTAQGALAISVGGTADPRLDNTFVWPTEGGPASTELLKAAAAKPASDFNKKAVAALFIARTLSIASFILTSIAYPFLAAPAVGWGVYGVLMALGPLAAIATGPLNGSLADKLSARSSMTINMAVRAVLTLMLPAFAYFGILNFWTLLLSSIANGWVLSAVMTTENAYIRRLAGKHQGTVMALGSVHYVALQAVLGLILGIGTVIDKWNPMIAFVISAAVHGLLLAPFLWFSMPSDAPPAAAQPGEKLSLKQRLGNWLAQVRQGGKPALRALVPEFLRKYWKEALLFGASVGAYTLLHSPIPIALALFYWVWNTDTVKSVRRGDTREVSGREKEIAAALQENGAADQADRAELERLKSSRPEGWEARAAEIEAVVARRAEQSKGLKAEGKRWTLRQFATILYSSLQAAVTYPFQNFALPLMATTLVGQAGKAALLGKLTGALFFGNLISNSSQAKLPDIRIPLIGKVNAQRLLQGAVLALAAAWVYTGLVPGSVLAAAAAAAIAAGLMWLSGHVTSKGWIKFLGLGLLAVWLPFLVWSLPGMIPFMSVQTALFLTMLVYGMFTGPSVVSFNTYLQTNTNKGDLGKVFGTSGSFVNTSTSMGYGLLSLAAGMFTSVFPSLLLPIGIAYGLAALAFWNAPKRMPGLPEKSIEKPEKK